MCYADCQDRCEGDRTALDICRRGCRDAGCDALKRSDTAYNAPLSAVAVDYGITQVVDGNWGVHAIMKKSLFSGEA